MLDLSNLSVTFTVHFTIRVKSLLISQSPLVTVLCFLSSFFFRYSFLSPSIHQYRNLSYERLEFIGDLIPNERF